MTAAAYLPFHIHRRPVLSRGLQLVSHASRLLESNLKY